MALGFETVFVTEQNRTEHGIYFNLSIYKQLIVGNKTCIRSIQGGLFIQGNDIIQ